jgi:hypothetical protein
MSEYMDALLSEHTGFTVTDDMKAAWCVQKIAQAQREADALLKHYEEQAQKVREQRDSTIQYFQGLLFPYFQMVPHKATKTQESYAMPGATLVLKHQDPEFKPDADKLLAHLKASGRTGCIKTVPATEKPSWADYKPFTQVVGGKLVDKDTGEVVEAVEVVTRPDKFEVNIDG